MPDRKDKKRDAPISYRPPKHLREEFYLRVQKSGLSTSGFLTNSWSSQEPPRQSRRASLDHKAVAKLSTHFAKYRDQLDRIEALGGEQGNTPLMQESIAILNEIRAILMDASGRRS